VTPLAPFARWTSVIIAAAALVDPAVPLPRRERPSIRVMSSEASDAADRLARSLRDAGFRVDGDEDEIATVVVGDRVPIGVSPDQTGASRDAPYRIPVWALDTTPQSPNVALVTATASNVRLPGQAVEIHVVLDATGVAGRTTRLEIEDAGIAVVSLDHRWNDTKETRERWSASLQYLPPGAPGGRLRVRAVPLPGESSVEDNTADVAFPPMRGPVRTLVVEAGVTWPALFVRRALEGEPGFTVSSVQRSSKNIATRAGSPPAALTRATLAPYEVALIGGPDNLTAADIGALRWFVEERGGVAVFVPDQRPSGRYVDAIGGAAPFQLKVVDEPLRLRGGADAPLASEVLVAQRVPPAARILASTPAGETVIFSARRGPGAVIFSGALDAWRYRGRDQDAFARFWRRTIADDASAVPPALEVSVQPAVLKPGGTARVIGRIRSTELPLTTDRIDLPSIDARAVSAGARVDMPVRMWPTAEPGVYEGQWRPSAAGDYNVSVTSGTLRGDAAVIVSGDVSRGSQADAEGLALAARASGGQVFTVDRASALVAAMSDAYPERRLTRSTRPMRSSWWLVPFSLLLTLEWLLRRKAGEA
jgi:hypothetical protein